MTECVREVWMPIVGCPFFEVSDQGRVRSRDRALVVERAGIGYSRRKSGHIVSQHTMKDGYKRAKVIRGGRWEAALVHRLVLQAFVGPCPDGMECRHLNGNPADNRLENLAWGTHSDNMYDVTRHGHSWTANLTHCKLGHEFTPENTIPRSDGGRSCRVCRHAAKERWRRRQGMSRKLKVTPRVREAIVASLRAGEKRGVIAEGHGLSISTIDRVAAEVSGSARASRRVPV